jgi:CrcB protein
MCGKQEPFDQTARYVLSFLGKKDNAIGWVIKNRYIKNGKNMGSYLLVFIGAGLGGMFRYALWMLNKATSFIPVGTLLANVAGCFCAGIMLAYMQKASIDRRLYLFLMPGFLGGFTTFSAFSVETLGLMQSGQIFGAVFNIVISVCGSLCMALVGYAAAKNFLL